MLSILFLETFHPPTPAVSNHFLIPHQASTPVSTHFSVPETSNLITKQRLTTPSWACIILPYSSRTVSLFLPTKCLALEGIVMSDYSTKIGDPIMSLLPYSSHRSFDQMLSPRGHWTFFLVPQSSDQHDDGSYREVLPFTSNNCYRLRLKEQLT